MGPHFFGRAGGVTALLEINMAGGFRAGPLARNYARIGRLTRTYGLTVDYDRMRDLPGGFVQAAS